VKTFTEVAAWCLGAFEAYGDASVPVCQLFFRWQPDLETFDGRGDDETLVCGMVLGEFVLVCGRSAIIPLPVRKGAPEATDEEVITYGAVRVTAGVWAITPSLNIDGFIHGFVVLYGVPDPAPWERLIVLAGAL
jgi:hypothetical protein